MNPFSIDGHWKIDPDRRQDRGSGQVTSYTMTHEEIEAKYGPKKERKRPVSGFNSEEVQEIRARERDERVEEDMRETKITKEQLFEECRKGGLSPENIKAIAKKYGTKASNIYARISQYRIRDVIEAEAKNMIKQAIAEEKVSAEVDIEEYPDIKQVSGEIRNAVTENVKESVNKITLAQEVDEMMELVPSNVDHPKHYNTGSIEVIDYLQDKLPPDMFEGFCVGNALKYLSRYRFKGGIEDLKKAQWYLDRIIKVMDRIKNVAG